MTSSNSPCSCCGWDAEKRGQCEHNIVKLDFHGPNGMHSRWTIGNKYVLKTRPSLVQGAWDWNYTDFRLWLAANTNIPVPKVYAAFADDDKRNFVIESKLEGKPIPEFGWESFDATTRLDIARQIVQILLPLRKFKSDAIMSVCGRPLGIGQIGFDLADRQRSTIFYRPIFENDDQFWEYLCKSLAYVDEDSRRTLRSMMPPCAPYVATPAFVDERSFNIEKKAGEEGFRVVGLDLTGVGYMPCWWWFAQSLMIRSIHSPDFGGAMSKAICSVGEYGDNESGYRAMSFMYAISACTTIKLVANGHGITLSDNQLRDYCASVIADEAQVASLPPPPPDRWVDDLWARLGRFAEVERPVSEVLLEQERFLLSMQEWNSPEQSPSLEQSPSSVQPPSSEPQTLPQRGGSNEGHGSVAH